MVSKDQGIGGIIFAVCAIIATLYIVFLFGANEIKNVGWFKDVGWFNDSSLVRFWVIAIPVFVAFIAIMGIGMWIGWTMATTPPPKPIEEITSEIEKEEKISEKTKEDEKPKTKK